MAQWNDESESRKGGVSQRTSDPIKPYDPNDLSLKKVLKDTLSPDSMVLSALFPKSRDEMAADDECLFAFETILLRMLIEFCILFQLQELAINILSFMLLQECSLQLTKGNFKLIM
ncbi:hypothetical protein WN944_014331 [Citrus x changshan-huyou]|uniref:Uncharacterized protein n=1 Tax=Citrus x changshan-huyou TaxID=2935761 RepID=A0AAP0QIM3_9ROSI